MTIEAHDFIQNRTFDEIAIGDTAHLVRTLRPEDIHLFRYVETADEAWSTLQEVYGLGRPQADTACGW